MSRSPKRMHFCMNRKHVVHFKSRMTPPCRNSFSAFVKNNSASKIALMGRTFSYLDCRVKHCIVGEVGIEPTRPFGQRILSPPRLPIPATPRYFSAYNKSSNGTIPLKVFSIVIIFHPTETSVAARRSLVQSIQCPLFPSGRSHKSSPP